MQSNAGVMIEDATQAQNFQNACILFGCCRYGNPVDETPIQGRTKNVFADIEGSILSYFSVNERQDHTLKRPKNDSFEHIDRVVQTV